MPKQLSPEHIAALKRAKDRQRAEGRLTLSEAHKALLSAAATRRWAERAREVLDVTTGRVYPNQRACAKALDVAPSGVGRALAGKAERAAGHKLRYLDECPDAKVRE